MPDSQLACLAFVSWFGPCRKNAPSCRKNPLAPFAFKT